VLERVLLRVPVSLVLVLWYLCSAQVLVHVLGYIFPCAGHGASYSIPVCRCWHKFCIGRTNFAGASAVVSIAVRKCCGACAEMLSLPVCMQVMVQAVDFPCAGAGASVAPPGAAGGGAALPGGPGPPAPAARCPAAPH
jgi:hypothetical protein